MPPKKKDLEETYVKLDPREHVLKRPDTYMGSTEKDTETVWLLKDDEEKMEQRKITYIPALYKIFDEILVNAADNKQNDPKGCTTVMVKVDQAKNEISVWNNGKSIPIEIHKKEKIYIPEMVFGHLLTSSHYDDEEERTVGGRNGYGAKVTNIMSTKFKVETYTGKTRTYYQQKWTDNMSKKSEPEIKENVKGFGSDDFTCVTFSPDLKRFKMDSLDDDIVAVMKKRVYDLAACVSEGSLTVKFNDVKVPVSSFENYIKLYPVTEDVKQLSFTTKDKKWSICVMPSLSGFTQVSFVNSIWTIKGGKHVEYIADQVVEKVRANLKRKKLEPKPAQVKQYLWIFVRSLIYNPAFDSQSKFYLNTPPAKFGTECEIPSALMTRICKVVQEPIEALASSSVFKAMDRKAKAGGRKNVLDVPKLEDANFAGRKGSEKCTLILTEGDSAKALAMAGISVVGRDYFGCFPLRGKMLNVREASTSVIIKNAEVQHLLKIMGLQMNKVYESVSELRYGHVMIMADQDHDGSHIKGLIINMFHHFWPSLLEMPHFLVEFVTPIVKVTPKKKGSEVISFFSLPEYMKWTDQHSHELKKFNIRYYKGLGTSRPEEGKEYFSALERHRIKFTYDGPRTEDESSILLAFDKKKADERKTWLGTYEAGTHVDHTKTAISIRDFVHKELILFSIADCERSLSSVVDGFKPSQRKVLFGCFKRNLKTSIRVAQLSGYISEHTAYHHGEASLQGTIVGMAAEFCGANNVNVLYPDGQFGTRYVGGKDHAQARYIYTKLKDVARAIFPTIDDNVLEYRNDDGASVEPVVFAPIIPMVLVNGSRGIGTGYSTFVPSYNPSDLVACIRAKLKGAKMEELPELKPWTRDWTGVVQKEDKDDRYSCNGIIRRVSPCVVNITELPIGAWICDYKEWLTELASQDVVHDFREHHTDTKVDFEVMMAKETLDSWEAEGLVKSFRLTGSLATSNMTMFDRKGRIMKFKTVYDIIEEFFAVRYGFYDLRKKYMVETLETECEKLKNMVRFVSEVVAGSLKVMKVKKKDLVAKLKASEYKWIPKSRKKTLAKGAVDSEEQKEEGGAANPDDMEIDEVGDDLTVDGSGFDYLLGMKLWSLTLEKIEALKRLLAQKQGELQKLLEQSLENMWEIDLDHFEKTFAASEKDRLEALTAHEKKGAKKGAKKVARLEESKVQPKVSEKAANILSTGIPTRRAAAKKAAAKGKKGAKAKAAGKKPATKPAAKRAKKEVELDEDGNPKPKPKPKAKAKRAKKADSEDGAPKPKPKPKAKASRKRKRDDSESEDSEATETESEYDSEADSFFDESESESESEEVWDSEGSESEGPAKKRARRSLID